MFASEFSSIRRNKTARFGPLHNDENSFELNKRESSVKAGKLGLSVRDYAPNKENSVSYSKNSKKLVGGVLRNSSIQALSKNATKTPSKQSKRRVLGDISNRNKENRGGDHNSTKLIKSKSKKIINQNPLTAKKSTRKKSSLSQSEQLPPSQKSKRLAFQDTVKFVSTKALKNKESKSNIIINDSKSHVIVAKVFDENIERQAGRTWEEEQKILDANGSDMDPTLDYCDGILDDYKTILQNEIDAYQESHKQYEREVKNRHEEDLIKFSRQRDNVNFGLEPFIDELANINLDNDIDLHGRQVDEYFQFENDESMWLK